MQAVGAEDKCGIFWFQRIAYNKARDKQNDEALAAAGWTVVRVWEHADPQEAAAAIAGLIRSLRAGIAVAVSRQAANHQGGLLAHRKHASL